MYTLDMVPKTVNIMVFGMSHRNTLFIMVFERFRRCKNTRKTNESSLLGEHVCNKINKHKVFERSQEKVARNVHSWGIFEDPKALWII